ncbi:MAG: hypothetical protein WCO98_02135 [bacterium]
MISSHRMRIIPESLIKVNVVFADCGSLACICKSDEGYATIFFHSILNNADTPVQVFEHIVIHELIHIRVPSREVDGKMKSHPPEFWEEEKIFSPERIYVWEWLIDNFYDVVRRDEEKEMTIVLRKWRKKKYTYKDWWLYINNLERYKFDKEMVL